MAKPALIQDLESKIGQEIGVSDWFLVEQAAIDTFGEVTDDVDPMHNDPEWGRNGPWGGTIAHGYHVVSLISSFLKHGLKLPILTNDRVFALNYGLDKVRFLTPFRIGKRARSHIVLSSIREKRPREFLVKTTHTIEIEGEDKPFMVAEALSLYVMT